MTVFITILLTNSYLPGCLVLASQLQQFHPTITRVILISKEITTASRDLIDDYYNEIIVLDNMIESDQLDKLDLFNRPDLKFTLTKIHIFKLIQFDKLIYFDCDILPLKALPDTILDLSISDTQILASPDASWPDIFNSGFLIVKPSLNTFNNLNSNILNSFDGADQGLLNQFFPNWTRLPFIYNVTITYGVNNYEYLPLINHFKDSIINIHYIGLPKPWIDRDVSRDPTGYYQMWWDCFNKEFTDLAGKIFEKTYDITPIDLSGPEAYNLKDVKVVNQWDVPDETLEVDADDAYDDDDDDDLPPAIFPWEEKRVKLERVFPPESDFLDLKNLKL